MSAHFVAAEHHSVCEGPAGLVFGAAATRLSGTGIVRSIIKSSGLEHHLRKETCTTQRERMSSTCLLGEDGGAVTGCVRNRK